MYQVMAYNSASVVCDAKPAQQERCGCTQGADYQRARFTRVPQGSEHGASAVPYPHVRTLTLRYLLRAVDRDPHVCTRTLLYLLRAVERAWLSSGLSESATAAGQKDSAMSARSSMPRYLCSRSALCSRRSFSCWICASCCDVGRGEQCAHVKRMSGVDECALRRHVWVEAKPH